VSTPASDDTPEVTQSGVSPAPGPTSAERRHGRLRALPLRVTLVIALVALVALGLLASGVAATTQLSGFLSDRTDAQLQGASALRGGTVHEPRVKGPRGTRPDGRPREDRRRAAAERAERERRSGRGGAEVLHDDR